MHLTSCATAVMVQVQEPDRLVMGFEYSHCQSMCYVAPLPSQVQLMQPVHSYTSHVFMQHSAAQIVQPFTSDAGCGLCQVGVPNTLSNCQQLVGTK